MKRRGISSTIGATILFAILFTTGTGFFTFLSMVTFQQQKAAADRLTMNLEQRQEQFTIVPLLQSGNIAFYVINTGGKPINITRTIISSSTSFQVLDPSNSPLPIFLNPGATSTTVVSGITPSTNVRYNIQIITARGNVGLGIYPSEEVIAKLAVPKIGYSFGSMRIKSCCYAVLANDQGDDPAKDGKDHVAVGDYSWRNPIIQWEEVQAAYWFAHKPKDTPQNETIWVKGWFYNLETYDVYIKSGSILVQIGFGGDNSKSFYMGGTLTEPVIIQSGLLGELTFKLTEFVSELKKSEKNLKGTYKDLPWEFGGIATFVGTKSTGDAVYDAKFKTLDPDFRTGAIVLDGIQVYGISMLSPSDLTFSKGDDTVPWTRQVKLSVTSYKRDATVPFTVSVSGVPGQTTVTLDKTTASPSASGVGLSDEVILTLTVTSASIGKGDYSITVKLTSTQTVAKAKAGTFETVIIDNKLLLHVLD
ncbi:MAG: hypothetical protein FJ358_05360 [Thaumarchaeota archaeon]|nr:hypothetical protein [Nitrososphaerota archaeon]